MALIYGDRDYICNYIGGEAVSLAIDYPGQEAFTAAGYENITLSDNSVVGQVRQHGNFSFSRVYQAGHLVPAYQPLGAFEIFTRFINGKSIATGEDIETSGDDIYSTVGDEHPDLKLSLPKPEPPVCYIRDPRNCQDVMWTKLANRQGVIINGVLYNSTEDYKGPGVDEIGFAQESDTAKVEDTEGEGDAEQAGDVEDAAGRLVMVVDTVLVAGLGVAVLGMIALW